MTYFTTTTKHSGDEIVVLKEDAPVWVADTVRECHPDGILPNDWVYEKVARIFDAFDLVVEAARDRTYRNAVFLAELAESLVDIYTHEQIEWLGSVPVAVAWVDEALDNGGGMSFSEAVTLAQHNMLAGMVESVAAALYVDHREAATS